MLVPIVPVVARDFNHLSELVTATIDRYGPNCDLNHIDVSGVLIMEGLFSMKKFNGEISRWNVSNVTSMVEMFYDCPFNGDISKWNVSKVERLSNMFQKSAFSGDLSKWNTARVERFNGLFLNGAFVGNISNWVFNPKGQRNMSNMFSDAQIARLQVPNIYCWACAIAVPDDFLLPTQWQGHFYKVVPTLLGLGLPLLETAKLVHQFWMEREITLDAWPLPSLI